MNIKEIDRALSELVELSTSEEEIEHYLEILEELKEKLE